MDTRQSYKSDILTTLILILLGVAGVSPLGRSLAEASFDWTFLALPTITPRDVAVVALDDASHKDLHQSSSPQWDRALHAELIRKLTAAHAHAVVFDLIFESTSTPESDQKLAEAARVHGNVYFGATLLPKMLPSGEVIGERQNLPIPILREAGRVGLVEHAEDEMVFRRHSSGTKGLQTLAWIAAQGARDRPLTGEESSERWIRYYGGAGSIPTLNYSSVLSNRLADLLQFSNRVVYVGDASGLSGIGSPPSDMRKTAMTRWTGERIPGVEINATVCQNNIREEWLERLPAPGHYSIVGVVGLISGLLIPRLRPWRSRLLATGAGIAFLWGVTVFAARFCNVWWIWIVPSFLQLPAGWLVSLWRERIGSIPQPAEDSKSARGLTEPAPAIPKVPDLILSRCVGRGACGEVWLARTLVDVWRVVKIVRAETEPEREFFERELRGVRHITELSLQHPGLVPILQVGLDHSKGFLYYVMQPADDASGAAAISEDTYEPRSLDQALRARTRLSPDEVVDLGLTLASALSFLHQKGLIHRDIKPSNILYIGGSPRLGDIGLVTAAGPEATFAGTPGYIPPEGPGEAQADVYALGMVLYKALTGTKYPDLPSHIFTNQVPGTVQLYRVILEACESDLKLRYSSVSALEGRLLECQSALASRKPDSFQP